MDKIFIGLFFCVDGKFLIDKVSKDSAAVYGDFLINPRSHHDVWNKKYRRILGVDFDYYPRGRVTYRKSDDTYIVYCDKCIDEQVKAAIGNIDDCNILFERDEHYQCHMCNEDYVI